MNFLSFPNYYHCLLFHCNSCTWRKLRVSVLKKCHLRCLWTHHWRRKWVWFPFHEHLLVSAVGGCQSWSLWHPQPAGLLRVRRPEGHAAGQAALPLATAERSVTSFPRGVHLRGDHCECTQTVLCCSEKETFTVTLFAFYIYPCIIYTFMSSFAYIITFF